MKTLLLAILVTASALLSNQGHASSGQVIHSSTMKVPVELTYVAIGWRDGGDCDLSPFMGMLGLSMFSGAMIGGIGGGAGAVIGAGIAAFSYSAGGIMMCTDRYKTKTKILNAKFGISVSELTKGRANVRISSKKLKNCKGFALDLFAEEDGYGNYDLYQNKETYLENQTIGKLSLAHKKASLEFSKEVVVLTPGKAENDCRWDLSNQPIENLETKVEIH